MRKFRWLLITGVVVLILAIAVSGVAAPIAKPSPRAFTGLYASRATCALFHDAQSGLSGVACGYNGTFIGSGTHGVNKEQVICVEMWDDAGTFFEFGCDYGKVVIDPVLRSAHIKGSVPIYDCYEDFCVAQESGSRIVVDVTVTGTGLMLRPGVFQDEFVGSELMPLWVGVMAQGGAGLLRDAKAVGHMTSSRFGQLSGTTGDAELWEGAGLFVAGNV